MFLMVYTIDEGASNNPHSGKTLILYHFVIGFFVCIIDVCSARDYSTTTLQQPTQWKNTYIILFCDWDFCVHYRGMQCKRLQHYTLILFCSIRIVIVVIYFHFVIFVYSKGLQRWTPLSYSITCYFYFVHLEFILYLCIHCNVTYGCVTQHMHTRP